MKPFLIFLSLFISGISFAQSNLPPCNGDNSGACFGKSSYDNGEYVGEFLNGLRYGQGIYTYANGDKYVGQYKDTRNGQGTFTWASGTKYVGKWLYGKQNGQGTFTFPSGEKYVGQFKDANYDGFGTLYNANGSIKQQGLWRDDEFVQTQSPPVVPKPPVNNAQDIKRQKCIRLGLVPGSADFQQCVN